MAGSSVRIGMVKEANSMKKSGTRKIAVGTRGYLDTGHGKPFETDLKLRNGDHVEYTIFDGRNHILRKVQFAKGYQRR